MGSPLGPSLGNRFLAYLEQNILDALWNIDNYISQNMLKILLFFLNHLIT